MSARRKTIPVAPSVGGYRIDHAYGETRRQAQEYLRRWHYLASDGNQGFMFVVVADDNTVAGACLLGNAMSENQERDLVVGACLGDHFKAGGMHLKALQGVFSANLANT